MTSLTDTAAGRRRLLLHVPIAPARSGNGLAMRAGVFLDALADTFDVTVWLVPVIGGRESEGDRWLAQRSSRVVVAPLEVDPLWTLSARTGRAYPRPALTRFATAPAIRHLTASLPAGEPYEALLTLRSYLAPFALPLLREDGLVRGLAALDLDDDEALTRGRIGDLLEQRGDRAGAEVERAEARKFEALEGEVLPAFDRLLVCHERHAAELRGRFPEARTVVVPNAISVPAASVAGAPLTGTAARGGFGGELRLLLVGNLSYFPNQDAALVACHEIVPRLYALGRATRLRLVGSAPPASIRGLASSTVEVHADVPDVWPHYAWADVVLAPIRAGGGTRIKLLEAFAHHVPVVATPLAAEGLDAEDDRHLLLGDSAEELAAACLRLDRDAGLRRRVADEALELVRSRYERQSVCRRVRELFGDLV